MQQYQAELNSINAIFSTVLAWIKAKFSLQEDREPCWRVILGVFPLSATRVPSMALSLPIFAIVTAGGIYPAREKM